MNRFVLGAIAAIVGVASVAGGYYAGKAGTKAAMNEAEPTVLAAPVQSPDTGEIETIVRNYLLKNPEIISELQVALEAKRELEAKATQTAFLSKSGSDLFTSPDDAIIGNPNGDVTVVEFFDYNCGYCRRALSDMDRLVKDDPQVRFVLKELPILGPDSTKAHIVAQAFRKLMPEKYADFHRSLLSSGRADEASATALAVSLGVDEAKLKAGMESSDISALFEKNNKLALGLNITGTPSYVIKDTVVPGALGFDVLSENVANVRKCQSTTC